MVFRLAPTRFLSRPNKSSIAPFVRGCPISERKSGSALAAPCLQCLVSFKGNDRDRRREGVALHAQASTIVLLHLFPVPLPFPAHGPRLPDTVHKLLWRTYLCQRAPREWRDCVPLPDRQSPLFLLGDDRPGASAPIPLVPADEAHHFPLLEEGDLQMAWQRDIDDGPTSGKTPAPSGHTISPCWVSAERQKQWA